MTKLLLIAFEGHEGSLGAGFAQALGLPFDVLTVTTPTDNNFGAARVLEAGLLEPPPADGLAAAIFGISEGYSHVAAISSMRSKDVMARLAGLMDAAMVTDAVAAQSSSVFRRPVYAGAAIATVEVLSQPVVITFRPSGFPKPNLGGASPREPLSWVVTSKVKRISVSVGGGSRPDLTQAKVVVSGGRPLKDAETFERIIGGLADALGGAVGATRAAVDSGIAANDLQVGQTGKVVAPDLYIAAGISGSTQHMAGIKDSKVIVAINKDAEAPIFEAADFGLVADLFDAVPALTSIVKN